MQHTGFAFLHMELTVKNAGLAGDTIHAECKMIEARRSKAAPAAASSRTRVRVVKQDGEDRADLHAAAPWGEAAMRDEGGRLGYTLLCPARFYPNALSTCADLDRLRGDQHRRRSHTARCAC